METPHERIKRMVNAEHVNIHGINIQSIKSTHESNTNTKLALSRSRDMAKRNHRLV